MACSSRSDKKTLYATIVFSMEEGEKFLNKTNDKHDRMRASPEQLDHFLAFMTSSRAIQDLPFGEKIRKLSSGTEIKIPNVIRTSIPKQIVKQYERYWEQIGYSSPSSRSSNLRILKVSSLFKDLTISLLTGRKPLMICKKLSRSLEIATNEECHG